MNGTFSPEYFDDVQRVLAPKGEDPMEKKDSAEETAPKIRSKTR
jgi:hypothetical protein